MTFSFSRLVQNFLRFPCAFSQSDVATRCPVVYRLRYNANLDDDQILIKQPSDGTEPEKLSSYLSKVMRAIEKKDGFSEGEGEGVRVSSYRQLRIHATNDDRFG